VASGAVAWFARCLAFCFPSFSEKIMPFKYCLALTLLPCAADQKARPDQAWRCATAQVEKENGHGGHE
jgi:uncharacterized protein (DUF302 family)